MDERALRELELLDVARLYGFEGTTAAIQSANAVIPAPDHGTRGQAPAGIQSHGASRATWAELRVLVTQCRACGLCQQRKQAVFGVGAEAGPWLFVGEGPGAEEDAQGDPFVGQAGKLLDAMLAAIGCQRGRDVYIANVVKCRPPGNRTPTAEEAAACAPFLDRQVELVAPKVIVALGKAAAARLLGTEASIASLRGKAHDYHGIPVIVTYHPAYLLRSLTEKAKAWEDLLFARRTLSHADRLSGDNALGNRVPGAP